MRLINKTKLDDYYLREIIKFVKPDSVSKFDVLVSMGGTGTHGNAKTEHYIRDTSVEGWQHKPWQHKPPSVRVYVSLGQSFPYVRHDNKNQKDAGYLPTLLLHPEEELCMVMAHELIHLWQFQHYQNWRGWYPRNPYRWSSRPSREYDACCYGKTLIRKIRRTFPSENRIDLLSFLLPVEIAIIKKPYFESKAMITVAADRPPRLQSKPEQSYKLQKLVTFFHCLRCGKEWIPRFPDKEPTVCKFCKNPYWNKPRQKK